MEEQGPTRLRRLERSVSAGGAKLGVRLPKESQLSVSEVLEVGRIQVLARAHNEHDCIGDILLGDD